MAFNYKNQLLEYCQKKRIDYPKFSSTLKLQGWISECHFQGSTTTSGFHSKKTDAEIEASGFMLNLLQLFQKLETKNFVPKETYGADLGRKETYGADLGRKETYGADLRDAGQKVEQQDTKFIVIVDAENVQFEILPLQIPVIFHVFYGYLAKLPEAFIESYEKYATLHTHKIALNEATDHMITFTLAELIGKGEIQPEKHTVVICSRDKSAAVQTEILKMHKIKVIHVTSKKELDSVLAGNFA